jgi:hypothetical protein
MQDLESRDPEGIGTTREAIRLAGFVLIPMLVGVTMGARWPDAGGDFYASTAQVIATLFIAIAVEFFAREASRKSAPLDRLRLVLLIAQSWAGFFACVRALAGDATAVTVGLASAGVTAASVLVSLTLYEQIRASSEESGEGGVVGQVIVLLFILVPVLVLIMP